MTKTLNAKLPMEIHVKLEENDQRNPSFMVEFVSNNIEKELTDNPLNMFTFTYSFKVSKELHKLVKLKAMDYDCSMGDYLGRLFSDHYKG